MSNTINANTQIETCEARLRSAGCRANRAFRRFARTQRHNALCRDLDVIRAEALAKKKPTWGDMDW